MIASYINQAREALDKSLEVREAVGIPFGVPLNIYDLCESLTPKIRVRFANYSMEGCYCRSERPLIEVSALRPLGRRVFSTAHELGHHVLGHAGMRLDQNLEYGSSGAKSDLDEYSANAFAGFLLMPKIGVRRAFTVRQWSITSPEPEQVFIIACHFGVGYETLVKHLVHGLREITAAQAAELEKVRLPSIRQRILGSAASTRLWVADHHYAMSTLDTEVGTTLLLPSGSQSEFANLVHNGDTPSGRVFTATKPGITRVETSNDSALIVRIARYQYSGWSTNRHLEPAEDDDE